MAVDRKYSFGMGVAGILGVGLLACTLWLQNGCMGNTSPMGPKPGPTVGPTPIATATAVVITAMAAGSSYAFSQSNITVPSGTTVTFNVSSIHTVDIDDGRSDGICGGNDLTSFPAGFIFAGLSGSVFHVHCDHHSTCAAGNCSGCTGMVMTVTIQ